MATAIPWRSAGRPLCPAFQVTKHNHLHRSNWPRTFPYALLSQKSRNCATFLAAFPRVPCSTLAWACRPCTKNMPTQAWFVVTAFMRSWVGFPSAAPTNANALGVRGGWWHSAAVPQIATNWGTAALCHQPPKDITAPMNRVTTSRANKWPIACRPPKSSRRGRRRFGRFPSAGPARRWPDRARMPLARRSPTAPGPQPR